MKSHGNIIFSGGGDNKVIAWDTSDAFKAIGEISTEGYINDIAIDSETGTVYIGGQNKFLTAISLQ
jgi:phage-related protein